ncbi:M67 family metallopeptidase [Erythrobacter sp.]|uniref:M67 family metallopeptidase n=1 Tax=Erythrobacter sp. TaxID=1042 RepID=UPI001425C141|nr:M67 family metallopeptidase [Erythrobacter sp.]QIQ86923.1 MAG: M67 family metallopeptidase [Erythrobacter sp.]
MRLEVTREAAEAMVAAARGAHPREACGILFGREARIERFVETANVHPEPTRHFEIDPQALIDAHRAEREGGPQVVGWFHSHPAGPAEPSATDRAMAAPDGRVWAIWGEENLAFFRAVEGGFEPLSSAIVDG